MSGSKLRKQWTMTDEEREEYLQIDEQDLLDELNDDEIEDLALFLDDLDPEVRTEIFYSVDTEPEMFDMLSE